MASVSSGMSTVTTSFVKDHAPNTIHVYNPFHVVKLIREAVAGVREGTCAQESYLEKRKQLEHWHKNAIG